MQLLFVAGSSWEEEAISPDKIGEEVDLYLPVV